MSGTPGPIMDFLTKCWYTFPGGLIILGASIVFVILYFIILLFVYIAAPLPRPPFASEVAYQTVKEDGTIITKRLPCWQDQWLKDQEKGKKDNEVEPAEVMVSMVVPAYNEEDRLTDMLDEAVAFLEENYSTSPSSSNNNNSSTANLKQRKPTTSSTPNGTHSTTSSKTSSTTSSTTPSTPTKGWEILIVSDGSTDRTVSLSLDYARTKLSHTPSSLRIITLARNRGKGGAVTHGLRHVRGQYVGFADADGASKFGDLAALISACQAAEAQDPRRCAFAMGSRAHLVGSETVVKRSKVRNFLMHSFHLLLRLLTPPATSKVKDTQCGFKLFSRNALPFIVPHMHSEGWIFDVEMLMLAERAGVKMVEVPVGWHEVKGSKLNVVWDSLGMAWGLAILRAAWGLGVYRT